MVHFVGARSAGTPPLGDAFKLADAPEGGWTWFTDPRAVHYNGTTYYGYLKGTNGDVIIRSYEHATNTLSSETVLHAALETDDHDDPAVFIRPSDGKIRVWYSAHLAANYYTRLSTNAEDISAFGSETNLDSTFGLTQYTYANPIYLSNSDGAGDALYHFFRNHTAGIPSWYYAASANEGTTWDAIVELHTLTYSRLEGDGVGAVHCVASDHPAGGNTKIYHLYRESAAWRQSDGTSMGATPFDAADMTVVYDGGAKKTWIHDIALDGSGDPVVVFVKFESDTDHRYWYGRWTGSAWDTNEIVAAGGPIPTDSVGANPLETYYSGGIVLDHEDPTIAYASVGLGSDLWEIRRYVTADGGATWDYDVISPTGGKNVRPAAVRDHDGTVRVLWMRGTYASYVDYSVGTWAWPAP